MTRRQALYAAISWLSLLSLLPFLLASCEADSYEKGDGQWSHTVADFGELWADGQKQGVSFVTDEGASFMLDKVVRASWIKTADSTYRASLYYNPVAAGVVHPVSCALVSTVRAKDPSAFSRQPQDPLGIESCWLSKSGKYLNLALLLKNGRDSEGKETVHTIALVLDETRQNADGTLTDYCRLLHDKHNAPEYYTNRTYVSILLPTTNRSDSVQLTINTSSGNWTKTIRVK